MEEIKTERLYDLSHTTLARTAAIGVLLPTRAMITALSASASSVAATEWFLTLATAGVRFALFQINDITSNNKKSGAFKSSAFLFTKRGIFGSCLKPFAPVVGY